ncbi:hypothetical protein HRbin23_01617 [bacterium HR23]|nr:hypothetical protein HRbin23_01617 [bacterium HR23]
MWRLFLGLVLVALGTLLLLERLGVVARALSVWWPVFLIALGVFLVVRGIFFRRQ